MSYYDNQQWSASSSQNWEQQTPPARSGTSSTVPREDSNAFATQLEEVNRAVENLMKSGKMFNTPGRRESMPVVGGPPRAYTDQSYDPRVGSGPSRHHSISDFGDARSFSTSNLQNFYANQRHQPSRGTNEAEQVMQAKRRMAAQRERELRNYHQEQQYNRSVTAEITSFGGKTDRIMTSNNGMKEDERRDLIARQRSALYNEGVPYTSDGVFDENESRTHCSSSQTTNGLLGHSPRSYDAFNTPNLGDNNQTHEESQYIVGQVSTQSGSRANSISSPSSNPPNNFGIFDSTTQQPSCTSSSTGDSPPHQGGKSVNSSVAPIGTRPSGQSAKRATTPLPSPLSYALAADESVPVEKETRIAQNHTQNSQVENEINLGWAKSSVWGNKSTLGVQASVWA